MEGVLGRISVIPQSAVGILVNVDTASAEEVENIQIDVEFKVLSKIEGFLDPQVHIGKGRIPAGAPFFSPHIDITLLDIEARREVDTLEIPIPGTP